MYIPTRMGDPPKGPILDWARYKPDGFSDKVWRMGQQGDFLRKQLAEHPSSLEETLDLYTGGESLWMNRVLRNDPECKVINTESMRRWERRNNQLADLINAAPTTDRNSYQVVFRGSAVGPPQYGSVWTKLDFTSTSLDWDQAAGFNTEHMMVIQIPPGASVLEITGGSLHPEENEILINRRSRFHVDKTVDVSGNLIHYLTLMGGTEPPGKRRRRDDLPNAGQLRCNSVTRLLTT